MQQHVWVQGRLVPVRSLSGVDLRSPKTESAQSEISSTTSSRRKERETDGGVHDGNESLRSTDKYGRSGNAGGSTRRRSIEEANNSAFDHDDDETAVSSHGERKELNAKYNKPRGFGIGGVGNISKSSEVNFGCAKCALIFACLRVALSYLVDTQLKFAQDDLQR